MLRPQRAAEKKSTGGEGVNALVCKTSIRRFNSGPVLHKFQTRAAMPAKTALSN
jgi:hypothetical protein